MKKQNESLPAAASSRMPCQACERRLILAREPQEKKYQIAAELLMDGLEDALGIVPVRSRAKTIEACVAILAYFFPQGAPTGATPQAETKRL